MSQGQVSKTSKTIIQGAHLKRRLGQIMISVALGLSTLVGSNLFFGASMQTTAVLAVTLLIIFGSYLLLRSGRLMTAAYVLLWTGTLVCMSLVWSNYGLRDTSLLAFPAILFFAAIIGDRRLFYTLYIFQMAGLVLVGFADLYGWREFSKREVAPDNIIDILVLLGFVGFCMRILSNDMRKVMKDLERENERSRLAEEQAYHRAHHDELTGLPNRFLAEERLNQALMRAQRSDKKVALLFVDIDYFKTYNDSLGHSVGDELIREIGRRLQSAIRRGDTVCRFGGDEFIVILADIPDSQVVRRCATDLLQTIAQPLTLAQRPLEVSASIGVAIGPDDGSDYHDLCSKADMAMYKAKESGRNQLKFFDEALNSEAQERLQLIAGLQQALRNDEFEVVYQPQIDIRSGQVIGAEALLRWNRPGHGQISPADFIAAAEETNLIIEIGHWVLHAACEQCLAWQKQGHNDLSVSVNVSPVQLTRNGFEELVNDALDATGLEPDFLELELLESLFIDADAVPDEALHNLSQRGVSFAIDDFGTGYSNLSYLSRFNAQRLKIDRCFVTDCLDKPEEMGPILTAIVQLGHGLNMEVVAEGIETAEVLAHIDNLGCDVGQGYYWAKPLSAQDFMDFLASRES